MKTILRLLKYMIILNTVLIVMIFTMGAMNRFAGMSQLFDLGNMTLQSFRAMRPMMWNQQGMNSPMMQEFVDRLSDQSTMVNMFMYTTDGRLIYSHKPPNPALITNDYKPRMIHGGRLVLYDQFVPAYGRGMGHGNHHGRNEEIISCIILDASRVISVNRINIIVLILALITESVLILIYFRCKKQLIAFDESEKRLRVIEQEATTGRLAAILAHEIKNPEQAEGGDNLNR